MRNEKTEKTWQEMTTREKILFSIFRKCIRTLDSARDKAVNDD